MGVPPNAVTHHAKQPHPIPGTHDRFQPHMVQKPLRSPHPNMHPPTPRVRPRCYPPRQHTSHRRRLHHPPRGGKHHKPPNHHRNKRHIRNPARIHERAQHPHHCNHRSQVPQSIQHLHATNRSSLKNPRTHRMHRRHVPSRLHRRYRLHTLRQLPHRGMVIQLRHFRSR